MSFTKAASAAIVGLGLLGGAPAYATLITQAAIISATSASAYGPVNGGSMYNVYTLNGDARALTLSTNNLVGGSQVITFTGTGFSVAPVGTTSYIIGIAIPGGTTNAIGLFDTVGSASSSESVPQLAINATTFATNNNGSTFGGYTISNFTVSQDLVSTDSGYGISGSFTISSVPEPASLAVLATGLLGIGFLRGRRRTSASAAA